MTAWKVSKASFKTEDEKEFVEEVVWLLNAPTGITELEKTFCGYRRSHSWERANLVEDILKKLVQLRTNWRLRNNVF